MRASQGPNSSPSVCVSTLAATLLQALSLPVSLASARGRGRLVIRAARVAGVEIPNQKRLETALTCVHSRSEVPPSGLPQLQSLTKHPPLCRYIYGIGPTTAKAILLETVRD